MPAQSRASDGLFCSIYDDRVLQRVVVEVAYLARGEDAAMVTRAEFDGARGCSAWPDAASASCICKRLALPWREVVTLALSSERDWARTIGKRRQATPFGQLSDAEVA